MAEKVWKYPRGVLKVLDRLEFDVDPRELLDFRVRETQVSVILADHRKYVFPLDELGLSLSKAKQEVAAK